jgi:hypothetical protein
MPRPGAWGMRSALGGSAQLEMRSPRGCRPLPSFVVLAGPLLPLLAILPLTEGSSDVPFLLLLLSVIMLLTPVSAAAHSSALFPEVHLHGASPSFPLFLRFPVPSDLQRRK